MEERPIRVRIAPSPTGLLHIGTARTALFNWLFARKMGGTFVLRSEDTDKERSRAEYEQDILKGLSWLGLEWDEGPQLDGSEKGEFGPYRQSARTPIYRRYLEKILAEDKAYYCYCTPEELDAERAQLEAAGKAPIYSGKCRHLATPPEGKVPQVIRMRMPAQKVSFQDMVRGSVEFDLSLFGDIVIAKSLDEVLYNFAAVVDDFEMRISHVIRGEDHISNTPKQIAIAKALGVTSPYFAHLPLILNADRSKFSKRTNKVSASEYRQMGYLPSAIVNFLALIGWHPTGDKEVFTDKELISEFEMSRVQKSGAVFNPEKLDWLNREHLRLLSDAQFADVAQQFAPEGTSLEILQRLAPLAKQKLKTLASLEEEFNFVFMMPEYDADLLVWKEGTRESAKEVLEGVVTALQTNNDLSAILEDKANSGLGRGAVYWPVRIALSGKKISPGPQEIAPILGITECTARINNAIVKLSN
jgi:glutamyl-tRNA synthetase